MKRKRTESKKNPTPQSKQKQKKRRKEKERKKGRKKEIDYWTFWLLPIEEHAGNAERLVERNEVDARIVKR